jgi:hypothetical protein
VVVRLVVVARVLVLVLAPMAVGMRMRLLSHAGMGVRVVVLVSMLVRVVVGMLVAAGGIAPGSPVRRVIVALDLPLALM